LDIYSGRFYKKGMKILHLLSDWKWTGPSEPVLNLCKELGRRGHDVTLAYQKPPLPVEGSLEKKVLEAGVKGTTQFYLNHALKVFHPASIWKNLSDISHLTTYLRQTGFDILNVHQSHDHILGGVAARRLGAPPMVIRTDHRRDPLKPTLGNRYLISELTDGIMTFSERARREDSKNFKLAPERVGKVTPALDLQRFDAEKARKDMRLVFDIKPGDVVIGMVARFQAYRRTDVFLQAIKDMVREFPHLKLLLVGRSSQMERSVLQPAERLGIEPWIIRAGYRTDDYLDTLATMDIFVFLMAGSDGTARALREAMAMGKPAVVANRGMLPELVDDGLTGFVVEDRPEAYVEATLPLLRDPDLRRRMGDAAREKAHREFRLDRQGEEVERFYEAMISLGKWKKRS
jgi:L-malate glycosyltransferase